jgi:hypothetical protein
MFLSPG